jgi:uncharacterized glyoxalase superfamily protein PhnB
MLKLIPTGEQGNTVLPPGFNTVTPYFFVANAESFVRFLVQGLGGTKTCRRLGRKTDARASYQHALALAKQEPERRFLEKRMSELST